MFGRRPLLGAAIIGGAAYHMGKRGQQARDQEDAQNQQIADLQQQQAYQQQAYQQQAPMHDVAPDAGSGEDKIGKLKELKGLLDSGVLTQAEFDLEKQKILQSM